MHWRKRLAVPAAMRWLTASAVLALTRETDGVGKPIVHPPMNVSSSLQAPCLAGTKNATPQGIPSCKRWRYEYDDDVTCRAASVVGTSGACAANAIGSGLLRIGLVDGRHSHPRFRVVERRWRLGASAGDGRHR